MLSIFGVAVTQNKRPSGQNVCFFFPQLRKEEETTVPIGPMCVHTILCASLSYTSLVEERKRWRLQAAWENQVYYGCFSEFQI